jgi:hypothetical protein
MCDSGRARARGGEAGEKTLARVVVGPFSILAHPRARYSLLLPSQRAPLSLVFPPPSGAEKKKYLSLRRCPAGSLVSVPDFLMSHVLSPFVLALIGSRCGRPYTPLVVYVVRGPPIRALCRYDNPRHIASGSLSITTCRLGEGLVEHTDRSPLRKSWWVREYLSTNPPYRFFRRRMIMRTSTARPCRSSGGDPPPSGVASSLAPRADSKLTKLDDC